MTRTTLPERNLDVLRSIAVMGVFADHVINALVGHQTLIAGWLGQSGVLAFFVHTSLVLMGSMEKDGARDRKGWISRFYIRRAFRIYPLAIVVIALVLLVRVPSDNVTRTAESYSVVDILANVALVQELFNRNNILGVLWTLPLELRMYAVLPFCYLIARKPSFRGMGLLLLAGLALAETYTLGLNSIPGIWRLRVLEFVPCFLSGVLAFWLLRRRPTRLPSWSWIPIIFADLAIGFAAWSVWTESWMVRAAFCLALGLTIPIVADLASSRLTRASHTVATYSYAIYLLHPIALWFGFNVLRDAPWPVRLIAIIGSLTLGCLAAYHLIEKPGITLGRAIVHQPSPREPEPAAP